MKHTFSGIVAPDFAPTALNQHYLNTATGEVYFSTGVSTIVDWKLAGGGGTSNGGILISSSNDLDWDTTVDSALLLTLSSDATLRINSDPTISSTLKINTASRLVVNATATGVLTIRSGKVSFGAARLVFRDASGGGMAAINNTTGQSNLSIAATGTYIFNVEVIIPPGAEVSYAILTRVG